MKKILYLVANDAYFLSHRLPIALAAKQQGFKVFLAAKATGQNKEIEKLGIGFIPLTKLDRGGLNPFKDFYALKEIIGIYKYNQPDIVHHAAMKPVLYGSIAAWICKVPRVINALTGLGYLFISNAMAVKIIRASVLAAFKWLFSKKTFCLIVQNRDDLKFFQNKMPEAHIEMIKGSGVNIDEFKPVPKKSTGPIRIALVSRMLWDKGVQEAIEAMRTLKNKGIKADLYLYGNPDSENPKSIPENHLKKWESEGMCHWKGHANDIAKVYQESDIALLPSYREGLPKSLIEAAASGLPIITTDVPGCREVIEEGVNGYLVPSKDARSIAECIEKLIKDKSLRTKMGQKSREKAEKEFSEKRVIKETLKLYTPINNM